MLNESKLKDYIRNIIKDFADTNESLGQGKIIEKFTVIDKSEFRKLINKIANELYDEYGNENNFTNLSKEDEDFFGKESDKTSEFYKMFKSKECHEAFKETIKNSIEINPKHIKTDEFYEVLKKYYEYYTSSDETKIFKPQNFNKDLSNDCEIFLRMLKVIK